MPCAKTRVRRCVPKALAISKAKRKVAKRKVAKRKVAKRKVAKRKVVAKRKRPIAPTRRRFEGRVKVWVRQAMADRGIHRSYYDVSFENNGGRLVLRSTDAASMIRKYGPVSLRAFGKAFDASLEAVGRRFHVPANVHVHESVVSKNHVCAYVRLGNDWRGAAENQRLRKPGYSG